MFAAVIGVESDFQSFPGKKKNVNHSDLKSLHSMQNLKKFSSRMSSFVYNSVVELTKTKKTVFVLIRIYNVKKSK